MYLFIPFLLRLLLLPFLEAQEVPEVTTESASSKVSLNEQPEKIAETCHGSIEGIDKHPYYTSIVSTYFDGDKSSEIIKTKERFGIIISENYVLGQADYFLDNEVGSNYTIEALVDGSKRETKHEKNKKFTLFKLSTPIRIPEAAIGIPEADDSPKPGDDVTILGLHYDRHSSKYEVVSVANVTLIDNQDCRNILSGVSASTALAEECKDSLYLVNFQQSCDDSVVLKMLLQNGQVVGLYETSVSTRDGRKVESYLDLAHQKNVIKKMMSV